ncbi:phage tail length tape measure family protein [Casimicrobium huifangae]|uniref:phage tail protein n=1 Tax=Casimicrobium huifangae TaxID=2591109 RepID=UPI00378323E6
MANLNIAIEIAAKDAASGVIGSITNALGGLGSLASGALTVGLGVAAAGVAGLGAGLTLAISEAMGAQEVLAQTEAVIKSTGGAAGMTADAIGDLATELSHNSRFAGDAIQEGENLLLTFTNIGSETFPMATQAMVDMATAMGTDVSSGAIQLGKALNDPVAGISALSRVGVTFTEDQKKVIESMVATGDVAGAQKVILDELNKEFGGSAAAAAQTMAGKFDVMKNRLLDVAEAIGGPLLDVGADLMDRFLIPALPVIEDLGGALAGLIQGLAGGDIEEAIGGLGEWDSVRAAIHWLGIDIYDFASKAQGVSDVIGALWKTITGGTDPTEKYLTLWETISDNFGSSAADAITGTVKGIVVSFETLGGAFATAWNSLSAIDFGPLMGALGGLFATIGADMPSAGSVVSTVADGIKIAAQGLADFMNNILLPAITSVVTWFTANWPQIKATGEEVMAGLQSGIETVANGIQSFWNEWGDEIMGIWQGVVDQTQSTFDLFRLAFEGKWYEFGEGLRKSWDEKWAAIQGIVQAGIDWFNTQDWGAIGTAILQGLANGITAATHFVVEAATAAAKAAFDAAKGFLGIQSPSKKFEWLGMNSALGYAQGMDAYAPAMAYATTGASSGAYNSAANVVAGGASMVFHIDARGAANGVESSIKAAVKEALQEAGYRSDRIRRTN